MLYFNDGWPHCHRWNVCYLYMFTKHESLDWRLSPTCLWMHCVLAQNDPPPSILVTWNLCAVPCTLYVHCTYSHAHAVYAHCSDIDMVLSSGSISVVSQFCTQYMALWQYRLRSAVSTTNLMFVHLSRLSLIWLRMPWASSQPAATLSRLKTTHIRSAVPCRSQSTA